MMTQNGRVWKGSGDCGGGGAGVLGHRFKYGEKTRINLGYTKIYPDCTIYIDKHVHERER